MSSPDGGHLGVTARREFSEFSACLRVSLLGREGQVYDDVCREIDVVLARFAKGVAAVDRPPDVARAMLNSPLIPRTGETVRVDVVIDASQPAMHPLVVSVAETCRYMLCEKGPEQYGWTVCSVVPFYADRCCAEIWFGPGDGQRSRCENRIWL